MKKNDWLLVVITGIYSFLFYGEMLGLNLGVFTLVLIFTLILKDKKVLENKNWIFVALGCVISSFTVSYYGNLLSMICNLVSTFLLVGISVNQKTGILFALIYGTGSLLSSPFYFAMRLMEKREDSVNKTVFNRKMRLAIFPILITVLFFFIYKNSNSIFASFANKINFNWISWQWLLFTAMASVFLYGLINPKSISTLREIDEVDSLEIKPDTQKELVLWGKKIMIIDEFFSAKVMFISINLLLGVVNLLDFNFIFLDTSLPNNMTYSQFLHQGVGMLVLSIAFSIAIILFYFRGELNFYNQNKAIKILAYVWMIQNVFLLLSVCMKNNLYIENYGLTYKRIGIYIYSLLTSIGILTTILKIYKAKTNVYLVKTNGWSFYVVLLGCSLLNWDNIIVDYTQKNKNGYDMYYLMSLNDTTIPSLIVLEKTLDNQFDKKEFQKHLKGKINHFRKFEKGKSWKSWNYQDEMVQREIDSRVNFDTFSYRRKLSLTSESRLSR